MQGWQCPGCGSCYAPFVGQCGHCQPKTVPGSHTTPYVQPGTRIPGTTTTPSPNQCSADPEREAAMLRTAR